MTDFAETRSMLKKTAMAHGADTPIGHAAHNLLEQTENYAKATHPEQRRQLAANIELAAAASRASDQPGALAQYRGDRT